MGRDVGAGGAVAHVVQNLRANITMSHDTTDIREMAHASRAFHLLMALLPRLVQFIPRPLRSRERLLRRRGER